MMLSKFTTNQTSRHFREGENPVPRPSWIPAFAGMTKRKRSTQETLGIGGALCSANVPRQRTASAVHGLLPQSERIRYSGCVSSSLMSLRRARHRPDPVSTSRHSREGGNPVLWPTHPARCLGAWGEWRSEIQEEAAGRGTIAEPLTPSAEAYTNLGANLLAQTQALQKRKLINAQ